jgi:hypothetical protein
MDKVFKYFNDFFKGLTGLMMGLLSLGIAAQFLFGKDALAEQNIDVIGTISGYVGEFAGNGFIGLIGLLIVWNLISSK